MDEILSQFKSLSLTEDTSDNHLIEYFIKNFTSVDINAISCRKHCAFITEIIVKILQNSDFFDSGLEILNLFIRDLYFCEYFSRHVGILTTLLQNLNKNYPNEQILKIFIYVGFRVKYLPSLDLHTIHSNLTEIFLASDCQFSLTVLAILSNRALSSKQTANKRFIRKLLENLRSNEATLPSLIVLLSLCSDKDISDKILNPYNLEQSIRLMILSVPESHVNARLCLIGMNVLRKMTDSEILLPEDLLHKLVDDFNTVDDFTSAMISSILYAFIKWQIKCSNGQLLGQSLCDTNFFSHVFNKLQSIQQSEDRYLHFTHMFSFLHEFTQSPEDSEDVHIFLNSYLYCELGDLNGCYFKFTTIILAILILIKSGHVKGLTDYIAVLITNLENFQDKFKPRDSYYFVSFTYNLVAEDVFFKLFKFLMKHGDSQLIGRVSQSHVFYYSVGHWLHDKAKFVDTLEILAHVVIDTERLAVHMNEWKFGKKTEHTCVENSAIAKIDLEALVARDKQIKLLTEFGDRCREEVVSLENEVNSVKISLKNCRNQCQEQSKAKTLAENQNEVQTIQILALNEELERLGTVEEEFKVLTNDHKELAGSYEEKLVDLADLKREYENLEEFSLKTKSSLDDVTSQLETLNARYADLGLKYGEETKAREDSDKLNCELKSALDCLEDTLGKKNFRIEEIDCENVILREDIERLETDCADLKTEICIKSNKIKHLTAKLSKIDELKHLFHSITDDE